MWSCLNCLGLIFFFLTLLQLGKYESERVSCSVRCLTLLNPTDCSLPGSSVHGILQTRILEWVAIPFSRRIFSTQGSNLGLLHCRQILYYLSCTVRLDYVSLREMSNVPYRLYIQRNEKHHKALRGFCQDSSAFMYHLQ